MQKEQGQALETQDSRAVYVKTFGCQMNVHDSQKIMTLLGDKGYHTVQQPEDADVILVNTCSVREKPEQKVLSAVGRYALLKRRNPELIVGVGGCFARQEGQTLLEKAPALDLVFGPDNIPELPGMIKNVREQHIPAVEVEFDPKDNVRFLNIAPEVLPSKLTAMVTIMKGCDKYCSFCIVPHVRGRERYRSAPEIVAEIRELCARGVKEIMLLGQSVTSYHWKDGDDQWSLARLLEQIDQVESLERLRFTSPYPRDFGEDLVSCYGRLRTLCEYVHLPFQSGSNRILYRMNRRHTREQYFEWVDALRARDPMMSLSSDVIVGFPGEEDQDFEETMDLIERVRFDQIYSFKYSPRPHTPASRKAQIPEEVKKQRLAILQGRQMEIMLEKNRALEGSDQHVLVEHHYKKDKSFMSGRTRYNKAVNFPGDASMIGQTVTVRVNRGTPHALFGELVSE